MLQRSRANTFFFQFYRSYAKITTGEKLMKFVSKFDFYQKFIFTRTQKSDNYIYIYIKLNRYTAKLFLLPKFN